MGDHQTYDQKIKGVYKGLVLLAVITLIEVGVSLFGKGHLGYLPTATWILAIVGLLLIGLSIYKAYFIIYEFMHMRYEVPGLMRSVLLPVLLLVWAIIAFFMEGDYWKVKNDKVKTRNERTMDKKSSKPMGTLQYQWSKEDLQ